MLLDGATKGVIYFALGSNVMHTPFVKTLLKTVINALADLPYQVLFKTDSSLDRIPKNFKVADWMPQQDILSKNIAMDMFKIIAFSANIYY